jgi:hypothetical protein
MARRFMMRVLFAVVRVFGMVVLFMVHIPGSLQSV